MQINIDSPLLSTLLTLSLATNVFFAFKFNIIRIGNVDKSRKSSGNRLSVNVGLINQIREKEPAAFKETKKQLEEKTKLIEKDSSLDLDGWFSKFEGVIFNENGEINTGFIELDYMLGKLSGSRLVTLLGAPSSGKTTFLLDITRNNAIRNKIPVLYFSLGTKSSVIVDRLISAEAFVDSMRLKSGMLRSEEDFSRVRDSLETLSKAPIFIDDTPHSNLDNIENRIRSFKKRARTSLVLIDGLDLIGTGASFESSLQSLRKLGVELDLPIFITANTQGKLSSKHRIHIEDLPDLYGRIPDTVLFLKEEIEDDNPIFHVSVLKNREGQCGYTELYHDYRRVTFLNIDKSQEFAKNLGTSSNER